MKRIRKVFIFTLIFLCASYFLLNASGVVKSHVYADDNTTTTTGTTSSSTSSNGAYSKYLEEKKAHHLETYGNEDYYPQGVEIIANADNYDAEHSDTDKSGVRPYDYEVTEGTDKGSRPYVVDNASDELKNSKLIYQEDSGSVSLAFNVQKAGFYSIYLDYFTVKGYSSSIERGIKINGETPFEGTEALTFSRVWKDSEESFEDGNFKSDTRGNHLKPKQVEEHTYTGTYLRDYMYYETTPYQFYFEEGLNYITFDAVKEPLVIYKLTVETAVEQKVYKDYLNDLLKTYPNNNLTNSSYRFEAERSLYKSSPTLYPTTDRSSSLTEPFSYTKTYLNAIGGTSWKVLGDWIEWEFTVPEDGYYNISMRAKQNMVRGMYSSRMVYIDDEILFDELNDVQFAYSGKWQNVTLGNEDGDFIFYFKAKDESGNAIKHTIRMEVTLGEYASLISRIQDVVTKLNNLYRSIISYTTVTPDANRDYQLHVRFPEYAGEDGLIAQYRNELQDISDNITRISGTKSDKTGVIDSVVVQLTDFLKDNLRSIPNRLSTFSNNISSLGTILNDLRELPLMIDYIEVHTPDVKIQKPNESFFRGMWDGVVSFFLSFFIDYSSISKTVEGGNTQRTIEVWMTQGRDQANVIRNLIDTDFTPKTNINVELKLTAADVLLKATLAGIGPDVALNVDSSLPVNYALRNAVLDLSSFIYELDANGAIVYADAYCYNEDGTVKKDSTGNFITMYKPVVKDKDFAFVWNGETYKEAVVRRYAEINGVTGKDTKSYSEILNSASIPNNFYMESSLSQFQFYFDSKYYTDTTIPDPRDGTTGTYALPEKQIFLMMFVRDDIMDEKGLSDVYDWDSMTWEDVIDLVADLQTDQLQFYLPVNDAGASALNPVFVTLLYQRNGRLYTKDNKETGLSSNEAMDAFEQWTEFYTLYSFPKSASFVNRFRSGEMPIGIAYYELYNTLSVFAPELKGKWSFHMIPGTRQADGTINHTATASGSGCVVMKQPALASEQVMNDSWEFVKWWSSYESQVSFGREMEGILGSAARHTTANVKALNALAWPKDDLEILMKQWEQSCEIPQIAGSYITGREMENAYRQVINKLYNPREVLFEYAEKINNEIDRKREEFKLEKRK